MKTDVDRNSAAPPCYAALRSCVETHLMACKKSQEPTKEALFGCEAVRRSAFWRGQSLAYETMLAALDEVMCELAVGDACMDVSENGFGNIRDVIAGVIQRCEPMGYVGRDGQYLKVLKTALEKEESAIDLLQEINRHVGNESPDTNRHVLPSRIRDAMEALVREMDCIV